MWHKTTAQIVLLIEEANENKIRSTPTIFLGCFSCSFDWTGAFVVLRLLLGFVGP